MPSNIWGMLQANLQFLPVNATDFTCTNQPAMSCIHFMK